MEYIEYNFTRERRRGGEKKRMMERVERVGEGKREREREREGGNCELHSSQEFGQQGSIRN